MSSRRPSSSSSSSSTAPPDMAAVSFGSSSGEASDYFCGDSGGGRRRPRTTKDNTDTPSRPAAAAALSTTTRPKAARRSLARAMLELSSAPSLTTMGSAGSGSSAGGDIDGSSGSGRSLNSLMSRALVGGVGVGLNSAAEAALSPLRACVGRTASAADCNDEVLSPSILVLDGLETIYRGRGGGGVFGSSMSSSAASSPTPASSIASAVGWGEAAVEAACSSLSKAGATGSGRISRGSSSASVGSSCPWDRRRGEGMIREAVERWAARADARICVGSVSYHYRQEEERNSSSASGGGGGDNGGGACESLQTLTRTPLPMESQALFPMGSVVSQTLTRTPLPRLHEVRPGRSAGGSSSSRGVGSNNLSIYTDGYLLPIHSMAADHLMHGEFDDALVLLEKIRDAHSRKYGVDDLVVAIDTHNIGAAKLLAGRRDEALVVFHEAVLAKKDCVGETHPLVADSLVEVGILLHARGELRRALSIFNEALDCCFNGPGDDDASPPSSHQREGRVDINPRWRRRSRSGSSTATCGGDSRGGAPLPRQHDALLVSRILNNIGCAVHDMGEDADAALWVLNEAMDVQKAALGSITIKAESSLLNLALTQANIGHVKLRAAAATSATAAVAAAANGGKDEGSDRAGGGAHEEASEALAHFEEALLVLQSVFGEDSQIETIRNTMDDILLAKDLAG